MEQAAIKTVYILICGVERIPLNSPKMTIPQKRLKQMKKKGINFLVSDTEVIEMFRARGDFSDVSEFARLILQSWREKYHRNERMLPFKYKDLSDAKLRKLLKRLIRTSNDYTQESTMSTNCLAYLVLNKKIFRLLTKKTKVYDYTGINISNKSSSGKEGKKKKKKFELMKMIERQMVDYYQKVKENSPVMKNNQIREMILLNFIVMLTNLNFFCDTLREDPESVRDEKNVRIEEQKGVKFEPIKNSEEFYFSDVILEHLFLLATLDLRKFKKSTSFYWKVKIVQRSIYCILNMYHKKLNKTILSSTQESASPLHSAFSDNSNEKKKNFSVTDFLREYEKYTGLKLTVKKFIKNTVYYLTLWGKVSSFGMIVFEKVFDACSGVPGSVEYFLEKELFMHLNSTLLQIKKDILKEAKNLRSNLRGGSKNLDIQYQTKRDESKIYMMKKYLCMMGVISSENGNPNFFFKNENGLLKLISESVSKLYTIIKKRTKGFSDVEARRLSENGEITINYFDWGGESFIDDVFYVIGCLGVDKLNDKNMMQLYSSNFIQTTLLDKIMNFQFFKFLSNTYKSNVFSLLSRLVTANKKICSLLWLDNTKNYRKLLTLLRFVMSGMKYYGPPMTRELTKQKIEKIDFEMYYGHAQRQDEIMKNFFDPAIKVLFYNVPLVVHHLFDVFLEREGKEFFYKTTDNGDLKGRYWDCMNIILKYPNPPKLIAMKLIYKMGLKWPKESRAFFRTMENWSPLKSIHHIQGEEDKKIFSKSHMIVFMELLKTDNSEKLNESWLPLVSDLMSLWLDDFNVKHVNGRGKSSLPKKNEKRSFGLIGSGNYRGIGHFNKSDTKVITTGDGTSSLNRVPLTVSLRCCNNCSKEDAPSLCSRCRSVHYCSRECQRKDWKTHKTLCEMMKNYAVV